VVEPHVGDWYTQVKKDTETAIERPLRVEHRLRSGAAQRSSSRRATATAWSRELVPRRCRM
jgi:hypothetical protein